MTLLTDFTFLGDGKGSGSVSAQGWVIIDGGVIGDMGYGQPPTAIADEVVDCSGLQLAPGFIDLHCHGGGGASFTDGGDAAHIAVHTHARAGTTSLMASLLSGSSDDLLRQVTELVPLARDGYIVGIHLEGPWISEHRAGAHAVSALRCPSTAEIYSLLQAGEGHIMMVTLAPELEGGIAAVRHLVEAGVVVAVGHTDGDEGATRAAIDAGATVATHLFNCMPPMTHREPGPVGALLLDPRVTVELIADMRHVHPSMLEVARRVAGAGRIALITDATAATGEGDGQYRLGSQDITVLQGCARLTHSGALAGSTLTLGAALQYAVDDAGWPVADALMSATATPARALTLGDRGRIERGLRADLVLLDAGLEVRGVLMLGQWIRRPTEPA